MRWLLAILVSLQLSAPGMEAIPTSPTQPAVGLQSSRASWSPPKSYCGYEPRGDANAREDHFRSLVRARNAITNAQPRVTDVGDIAAIEDNGTLVIPPNKFDLAKRSLVFTPSVEGYAVAGGNLEFNADFGSRLSNFVGVDGMPGNEDDGYERVPLQGAEFPFYGQPRDAIFVGTNGYITFEKGDTSPRPSASALTTDSARIAPLWADLDASEKGSIYYTRTNDRHIITWNTVPQFGRSGTSTFQVVLYDDGRIGFIYEKVKARTVLVGLSPGGFEGPFPAPFSVDFSMPSDDHFNGTFYEFFAKEKRLDVPAVLRAFYSAHGDIFDTVYIWTDFDFDNGEGFAHFFNVRNDIKGIGLPLFDRGRLYGSAARLSSLATMGNIESDWPDDPQANAAGLISAVGIVCHEQGHRWLAYVHFEDGRRTRDDLLGRQNSHWSFLVDTRTNSQGSLSSLMEGNAWRDNGNGSFTTSESAVNYFTELDQYLMGLRGADEVSEISYLAVDDDGLTQLLRDKSPQSGITIAARKKTTSVAKIIAREGPREPDVANSPKSFRIGFVLLSEQGSSPSSATIAKLDRYRGALVRYFSVATGRRGSLDSSLR